MRRSSKKSWSSRMSSTVTSDSSKSQTCPCNEFKNINNSSISEPCSCLEINLQKELILFFYNTVMMDHHLDEYSFERENDLAMYEGFSDTKRISMNKSGERPKQKSFEKKDLRKLSREERSNTLIGVTGSEVIIKKNKGRSSTISLRGNSLVQSKSRSSTFNTLQPITEDNQVVTKVATAEKLLSTTTFDVDWLVRREEKYAKIKFKNGNSYEGEVLDKLPHGFGTFLWMDGTVYEGEFQEGSPTGRGRMQLQDMTEYTGIFHKGLFHGKGVYNIRNTNMIYSGNWKYGKKHGYGWLLYEPSIWYEGVFKDDLRHGEGFFKFKDGSCYQGQYSKNMREGRGAMRWSNNDIYIGEWSEGLINGFGEYSWRTEFQNFISFPVQHHYKGSWVKGKRTGTGVMFFGNENGSKMAGFFQDNFKHGAAVVMCGNGKSIEKNPLFLNDKPLHTTTLSNEDIAKESSSFTLNEQVLQSIIKKDSSDKHTSSKLEHPTQEKEALCSPTEIQINSPADEIELFFYIEKAMGMYVNAFDTIQFDIESIDSCFSDSLNTSKLQLSKWNLMTMTNSVCYSKMKQETQGKTSLNQALPIYNKSYTRFQSTVKNEEKYLRNVITRYLPKLVEVYYHYATITSPKKVYFKHYMIRMFLWQLYLDIDITNIGISLVEIDRLLDENPSSFVESCHHPFEHIYFYQFIQSLLGTSLLVHYKSKEEVHSGEGLVPHIFQKFLLEKVFPQAGAHKGRCLFEYKDVLSIKNVYALYLKLGQPHTARSFLNATCTKKRHDPPCYKSWHDKKCRSVSCTLGQNVNIIGHNFLYIPEQSDIHEATEKYMHIPDDLDPFFQDLSAFRVLGPKMIVKCLSSVCPPILKNGILCNMNYLMTFLEFYEVLICCALLMVARNRKMKEVLQKVISSKTIRTEEDEIQVDDLRKFSGKLKKKK